MGFLHYLLIPSCNSIRPELLGVFCSETWILLSDICFVFRKAEAYSDIFLVVKNYENSSIYFYFIQKCLPFIHLFYSETRRIQSDWRCERVVARGGDLHQRTLALQEAGTMLQSQLCHSRKQVQCYSHGVLALKQTGTMLQPWTLAHQETGTMLQPLALLLQKTGTMLQPRA